MLSWTVRNGKLLGIWGQPWRLVLSQKVENRLILKNKVDRPICLNTYFNSWCWKDLWIITNIASWSLTKSPLALATRVVQARHKSLLIYIAQCQNWFFTIHLICLCVIIVCIFCTPTQSGWCGQNYNVLTLIIHRACVEWRDQYIVILIWSHFEKGWTRPENY